MSCPALLQTLFRRLGARQPGLLDLLLILLGAGLAFWLMPGPTEGPGL